MRNGFEKSAIALGIGLIVLVGLADAIPSGLEPSSPSEPRTVARKTSAAGNPPAIPAPETPRAEAVARDLAQRAAAASPSPVDAPTLPPAAPAPERPLRERLERTIARAERERGFTIHPRVVDAVVDQGDVRILFPIAVDDHEAARSTLAAHTVSTSGTEAAPALRFFPLVGQAAARVDGEQLIALIASGLLPSVDLDEIHRPSLAVTVPLIRADESHAAGDDAAGRTIAILDTGIDTSHPMFAGRIVEEACFSLLGSCPDATSAMVGVGAAVPCTGSGCGHGTSVAGVAAGRAADDSLVGVAPGADVIAIQVFSELGGGDIGAYTSDIVQGLQHVLGLSMTHTIDVVNLSLGGATHETTAACDASASSTVSTVGRLLDAGIVTVAAGGNDGLVDAITSPACLSNVIAVGATTAADVVPGFSNSVDLLSLLAPGSSIESARSGGGTSIVGGTSMASPHVAGAIALLRDRYPLATPAEIENALVLSGVPVYDPRGDVTLPRIDVQASIDLLAAAAAAVGSGSGGGASSPAATSDGGGGGGACGLVGLEPFLVVGAIRLQRRRRRAV